MSDPNEKVTVTIEISRGDAGQLMVMASQYYSRRDFFLTKHQWHIVWSTMQMIGERALEVGE